ncbi:MAG TPA: hypothetical protein VGK12_08295, partial [Actinomycetota bacterium]
MRTSYVGTGVGLPFRSRSPNGSASTSRLTASNVAWPIRIPPAGAAACSRAATFVVSPTAVKLRCAPAPTLPSAAGPELMPIRNLGQSGWSSEVSVTARCIAVAA